MQSAGRGRPGARGPASSVAASRFPSAGFRAGRRIPGRTLAGVGVAVRARLEAMGYTGVALKWPNDLIHRHLKFGGILIE